MPTSNRTATVHRGRLERLPAAVVPTADGRDRRRARRLRRPDGHDHLARIRPTDFATGIGLAYFSGYDKHHHAVFEPGSESQAKQIALPPPRHHVPPGHPPPPVHVPPCGLRCV
jgi:hypothetical protein